MSLLDEVFAATASRLASTPDVARMLYHGDHPRMPSPAQTDWLRTVAISKFEPRIEYTVLKAQWRPVAWGAYAFPGAVQKLDRACRYEFGPLPPLDAGLGSFDTPAWRKANGYLFIGIAPSDYVAGLVADYADLFVSFMQIVERRLRRGIPKKKPNPGESLPLVVPRGHICPRCTKSLPLMAVMCNSCGWSLSTARSDGSSEQKYPDFLPDT